MTHRNRLHSLFWTGAVIVALALSLVLTLQVKAVGSEIAATEKRIIATKQQIAVLETEFQTRSRQQQLVRWNEVEFGYVAPRAAQFLDGRAQLAALGKPVEIMEAAPIRMAAADPAEGEIAAQSAATVRMASAADAAPVLKGDAARAGASEAQPVRLASAPTMMRQLVARDAPTKGPAAKVAQTPPVPDRAIKPQQAEAPTRTAEAFANRFDLDSVIAGGSR